MGGSNWLLVDVKAPICVVAVSSLMPLDPPLGYKLTWEVTKRWFGRPDNGDMVRQLFPTKASIEQGCGIGVCVWVIGVVLLWAAEEPFPTNNIIAWARI